MRVVLAKNHGFCYGVKRAINMIYQAIDDNTLAKKNGDASRQIYTYGEIIHNKNVLEDLKNKNVKIANNIDEIADDSVVVIRSHGATKDDMQKLAIKKVEVINATCPSVLKIHRIVEENYNNGYRIIIFGDKSHPEVIATNSYAQNSAFITNSPDASDVPVDKNVIVVAQTTADKNKFKEFCINFEKIAKKACILYHVFDTICSATENRQNEAQDLAEKMDAMLIIGGKNSSNTQKLFDICAKISPNTYFAENVSQLPIEKLNQHNSIGVTTGASTPEWILEEVILKMTEENLQTTQTTNETIATTEANATFTASDDSTLPTTTAKTAIASDDSTEDFADLFEKSLVSLYTGEIVKGVVIEVTPTEIVLDLGFKSDGIISSDELSTDPNKKPSDVAKVGDELEAFVIRVNDMEGKVALSLRKLEQREGYKEIDDAYENKTVLQGVVKRAINGGLLVSVKDIRVFVPASQASNRFVEDLSTLVGKSVSLKITEVNKKRRKIVGSIKQASNENRSKLKSETLENIEVGKHYAGKVKTLTSFGAFVDIGGVDGLVHISELTWNNIRKPDEVVKEGDEIDVYVKEIDLEKNRISLGHKNPDEDPWKKVSINIGDVVNAKIVRIVPFGAFAEVSPNVDGLIHISQLDIKHVANVQSCVNIGDVVECKVLDIDYDNKKISLSRAAMMPGYSEEYVPIETDGDDADEINGIDITKSTKDSTDVAVPNAGPTTTEAIEPNEPAEPVAPTDSTESTDEE
ncbi:MAG: bifunctional 4-hydroxy-3-methylbut-2-enyl diphosphate reductase/30S ribosomal protein S1 [Clostridiales bacterium]|jgi:4-hydroxy-3-methylbut-2-enyl diphosphate reductase|nr:bifunctional 4-hydroxy-3-methylbut-2-enyl diphosphate reductase/30S ribosomal protein S1 [Clostridiales bacterium]